MYFRLGTLLKMPVQSAQLFKRHSKRGFLKDPTDVAAIDSTLALHAATPTVQAFYSFYEDRYGAEGGVRLENGKETQGQAWVDWYGRVVCTAQELQEVINETSERHLHLF